MKTADLVKFGMGVLSVAGGVALGMFMYQKWMAPKTPTA